MLPDEIKLVVPRIDIEDRPNSNHVVVTVSHVLNVLMLQRHLAEQLKLVRGLPENLLCRIETIHQQRPPARALVLQAVKHLDAAWARESRAQDIGPQGPRKRYMDAAHFPDGCDTLICNTIHFVKTCLTVLAISSGPISHILLSEQRANCLHRLLN